jgi:hypothetical protein
MKQGNLPLITVRYKRKQGNLPNRRTNNNNNNNNNNNKSNI